MFEHVSKKSGGAIYFAINPDGFGLGDWHKNFGVIENVEQTLKEQGAELLARVKHAHVNEYGEPADVVFAFHLDCCVQEGNGLNAHADDKTK